MSYTGRIRIIIILIAIIPPLITMAVSYYITNDKLKSESLNFAHERLELYNNYQAKQEKEFDENLEQLLNSNEFTADMRRLSPGRPVKLSVDPNFYQFDFLEITDNTKKVIASFYRPGLIGESLFDKLNHQNKSGTIEYDLNGKHPAISQLVKIDDNRLVYCGQFIDNDDIQLFQNLLSAQLLLIDNSDSLNSSIAQMTDGQLYNFDKKVMAKLIGSKNDQFYMLAEFLIPDNSNYLFYTLGITAIVALASIFIAIVLGVYITGRTKREIDNLITATDRISKGDFNTPVMAYEEGEFSQLADSFTEMMQRLKKIQHQLATTEKIAAWQTVGRKIAHEIKNPLSPILISVDDLKSSYHDKLPNFDQTLNETTSTIKEEVERLTKLLDEFVSFARMKQPDMKRQKIHPFIDTLETFYKNEIDNKTLTINSANFGQKEFSFDADLLKQVLINLIKNSFESNEEPKIKLSFVNDNNNMIIKIEDNGPGFSDEKLANSFEPYQTTKPGGSGLGLVICHRIIHDHGGTLELSNADNGGAVVSIQIPR